MTSGDRLALEIVQTRDVTPAEARRMSRFAMHAIFRQARRDPLYWIFKSISLGGWIASFLIFVDFARTDAGSAFPVWIWIAALIGIAAYLAMLGRARLVAARANRDLHRAGHRYRITEEGLGVDGQGIVSHISWHYIGAIANHTSNLLVYIGVAQVVAVPKVACENQDVEAFCAELTRRWQAHRAAAQPDPAA